MKRIYIIAILILILILTGCGKVISAETIVATTVNPLEQIVADKENEIDILNGQIDDLTVSLAIGKEETEKYAYLVRNLNNLLKNVYYGYASNNGGSEYFTAFSIYYHGSYYLLTAGHCVKNEHGEFGNFKFKANFSDEWIYPKLLVYDNDFNSNEDYAIFTDKKINNGFKIGKVYKKNFILGSMDNRLNIIKELLKESINGESGSPVININGEILGIFTGGFTNIQIVLNRIDELK